MRHRPGLPLAALAALVVACVFGAGLAAARLCDRPMKAAQAAAATAVVELVIAVDISYSMDPDELALQREGYILGITSAEFLNALKQGIHGRIAMTYFEWAGVADQRVVVPWRMIDGAA